MTNEVVTMESAHSQSATVTKVEVTAIGVQGPPGPRGADGQNFNIGAVGLLSERSNYDDQDAGFSYLASDDGNIYFRVGASGWGAPVVFRGEQGPQGDRGEVGPQGVPGDPGPKGDQGDPGPKGDQGSQGPPGAVGTGINIIGSLDDPGDLPTSGSQGDSYIIGGNLWVWGTSAWTNEGNIQGPKGDQGDQGPKGDQGDPGPQGEPGGAATTYLLTGTVVEFANGEMQHINLVEDTVLTSALAAGESVALRITGADNHALTLPVAYWLGPPPAWTGDDLVLLWRDAVSNNGSYFGGFAPNATSDLTGTVTDVAASSVFNLTALGATDWVKFDAPTGTLSTIRKAYPVVAIGASSSAQTSVVATNNVARPSYTWTDGTPVTIGDVHSGVIFYGAPNATYFEIEFPADTTRRVAKVYLGGWNIGLKCSAKLNGVELYSETTTHASVFESVFAVEYVGTAPNQTMTMRVDFISGTAMSAIMSIFAATMEVAA